MITISDDGYVNYPDLMIIHCGHVLKNHTVPHKYICTIIICQLKIKDDKFYVENKMIIKKAAHNRMSVSQFIYSFLHLFIRS